MPQVLIHQYTTKEPITMIGFAAGICYNADITNPEKNYKRGLDCIVSNHGRTIEFPDVYMTLSGYSARVIREWYTHLGGAPTRLQASTRYIDYEHGFDYVIPPSIEQNREAKETYERTMAYIKNSLSRLDDLGIPREDSAMELPLGMTTVVVDKRNARNLMDMSRNRMCSRAYHEFQNMFADVESALRAYSPEWYTLVNLLFKPKCDILGYCPEKKGCGRHKQRIEDISSATNPPYTQYEHIGKDDAQSVSDS